MHSLAIATRLAGLTLCTLLASCADPGPQASAAAALSDDDFAPALRVRAATIEPREIQRDATTTGVVHPFRQALIAAEVAGRVVERHIEPGTLVDKGQVMFELDTERARLSLARSQAEVQASEVDARKAQHDLRQGESLIADNVISQDTLDNLRFAAERARSQRSAARAALATAERAVADGRIRAPFAGSTEQVHAQVGDFLNPGTAVAVLADFSRARVIAGVTAAEAARVAPGQLTSLAFPTLDGRTIEGKVSSVARVPDPGSGTYNVEIWLDEEAAAGLREGVIASVNLADDERTIALAVPNKALLRRNGELYVYRVQGDESGYHAELRSVSLGARDGLYSEVLDGLDAGDSVVIDGQFALSDQARVDVLP